MTTTNGWDLDRSLDDLFARMRTHGLHYPTHVLTAFRNSFLAYQNGEDDRADLRALYLAAEGAFLEGMNHAERADWDRRYLAFNESEKKRYASPE